LIRWARRRKVAAMVLMSDRSPQAAREMFHDQGKVAQAPAGRLKEYFQNPLIKHLMQGERGLGWGLADVWVILLAGESPVRRKMVGEGAQPPSAFYFQDYEWADAAFPVRLRPRLLNFAHTGRGLGRLRLLRSSARARAK
jgi:hypothetical protein